MRMFKLSAVTALLVTGVTAGGLSLYENPKTNQVFTEPGEGRIKLGNFIDEMTAKDSMNEVIKKVSTNSKETTPSVKKDDSFLDRFHLKGDMRLRYETIEKGENSNKYRTRYRFRYNVNVDIMDKLLLETAVSSGKFNPTSGNVSFKDDDNWADYFIDVLKLDVADLKYSFGNSWIRVGKSKHHIYRPLKTQLVWDNDIRLEGLNYGFKNDNSQMRFGINQVHREEGNKVGDDINVFIAQYVHTQKLADINAKLNLGSAYYYYDGVKGTTNPYGDSKGNASDKGFKGNSYSDGVYTEDYGILEAFGEMQFKNVMGKPFKTALALAYNTLADEENLGYDFSMEYGATKKVGDLKGAFTYRSVEKDSVLGAHNDSDFSGGGTDSKGYYVKAKYKFAKNIDLGAWANWSKLGDSETDYHRVQLDVILKF